MATPNFASILDEAPTEIVRPKPLPEGTYLCVVKSYELGASKQKQTPYVRFNLQTIDALEDVDAEALAASGGLDNKTVRVDYWLTADAVYRLDEFHEHCGLDLSVEMQRKFRNDEVINAQVLAHIKQDIDADDATRIYLNVTKTAPAE